MAFIRPDLLRKSLKHLRLLSPQVLYVSIDGPRSKDEEALVEECRSIALNPGWNCEIIPLFRDENIGLVQSFVKSMDKMFSEHEFGIFLEDDVLLSPTFMKFAEEIFIKYRNNDRVGHINASNFLPKYDSAKDYSYYFSQYSHVWGFGTWSRMWKKYDIQMSTWKTANQRKLLSDHCFSRREKLGLKKMFDLHCQNQDPWACDYQWQFNLLYNNSLCITPTHNMSLNIGFDRSDSTHTFGSNPFASPLENTQFPICHRKEIERTLDYDEKLSCKMCPSHFVFYRDKILNRFKRFFYS